jgi:hypothetical protein
VLELDASVGGGEAPVHAGLGAVARRLPGGDFPEELAGRVIAELPAWVQQELANVHVMIDARPPAGPAGPVRGRPLAYARRRVHGAAGPDHALPFYDPARGSDGGRPGRRPATSRRARGGAPDGPLRPPTAGHGPLPTAPSAHPRRLGRPTGPLGGPEAAGATGRRAGGGDRPPPAARHCPLPGRPGPRRRRRALQRRDRPRPLRPDAAHRQERHVYPRRRGGAPGMLYTLRATAQ